MAFKPLLSYRLLQYNQLNVTLSFLLTRISSITQIFIVVFIITQIFIVVFIITINIQSIGSDIFDNRGLGGSK